MKKIIPFLMLLLSPCMAIAQAPHDDYIHFPPGKFKCGNIHHRAISVENHTIDSQKDVDSMVGNYFYPLTAGQVTFKPIPRIVIESAINNAMSNCKDYVVMIDDTTHHDDNDYADNNDHIEFKVVSGLLNDNMGTNFARKSNQKSRQINLKIFDGNKNYFSVALFKGILECSSAQTFYFSHGRRIYMQDGRLVAADPSIIVRFVNKEGQTQYCNYSQDPPTKHP